MDISEYIGKWITCDYKPAFTAGFNINDKNLSILSIPQLKKKGVCLMKIKSVEETKEDFIVKVNYDYLIIYNKSHSKNYIINKNYFSYFHKKAKFRETSIRSLNSNIHNIFERVFKGVNVYIDEIV